MRGKPGDIFTTVRSEGALLPAEILRRIVEGDRGLEGLDPESYHLEKSEKINEAINRAWFRCLGAWRTFQAAAGKLPESDTGTTLTRERWLLVLFQELGYGRLLIAKAQEIGGNTYPISHLWHHTPIHLISFRQDLDRRLPGVAGAARLSPHSLVQEFLNRSESHLWGIVGNGLRLRILRDNISLTRQAYVEFDLESIMEGEIYTDFVLLYLLLHQSRLEAEKPEECWLENWSREAQERGTRALDRLRDGVEQAITALGQGFLAHPENTVLRQALQSGTLSPLGYYQQLLRLIYRFIFLFVAEDRGLIPLPDIAVAIRNRYAFYAIDRLRRLAGKRRGTRHGDLYAGLQVNFTCLEKGEPNLGIPALNGFLFSPETLPDLHGCKLANDALLAAIRGLTYTEESRLLRPVDYRNLGTEELGSVYESLLELHPELNAEAFTFALKTFAGSERKTTGSYYTHPSLIRCLLDSALEPLLTEAMKKPNAEEALLSLKVVDPACGSGHFLIAAAHRIAKDLAIVRTGEGEPPLESLREALRDVVANCIYGVDINPLAVELCKVSLWLESLDPKKPLGFLDHRIKCGNSIIGATPDLLKIGIPDNTFKPIEGDDPAAASSIRKKNKEERKGQQDLFMIQEDRTDWREAASAYATWASLPEDDIEQISEKARQYNTLLEGHAIRHQHNLADIWTAAFFWPLTKETYDTVPTQDVFRRLRDGAYSLAGKTAGQVKSLADEHRFFHWHLEFPEVFMKRQGFDCVLGNPPWERINLEDRQFFATSCPEIARASTTKRRSMIKSLKTQDPQLYVSYQEAQRFAATEIKWFQNSGKYLHLNQARLNTYVLFVELSMALIAPKGLCGIIVPSGVATDDISRRLFTVLNVDHRLVSLYDFENREGIFPAVHRSYKFCLLTMGGLNVAPKGSDFAFFLTNTSHLNESDRHFGLSADDLHLLSPITGLCPTFRNKRDRGIVLEIYKRISSFVIQKESTDHWGSSDYLIMFRSDSSSHLYKSPEDLGLDYPLSPGPQQLTAGEALFLPVWESKLIHQFDHRYASYEGVSPEDRREGKPREIAPAEKEYVHSAQPRYWVLDAEIIDILQKRGWAHKWVMGYRDITNATNERTAIAAVLSIGGASQPLNLFLPESAWQGVLWLVAMNSFVVDYVVRQSIGGVHLNITTCRQLPIIADVKPDSHVGKLILNAACELVYTSATLESFASDLGYNGPPLHWDNERRFKIRCELDALYFHLYGISRDDTDYILETFPIVKRKDIAKYGEYHTKKLILEIYDAMQHTKETGRSYQTILDPPPADPRCCHQPRGDE